MNYIKKYKMAVLKYALTIYMISLFYSNKLSCVFASGIFPENYYCLAQQKSMIMCPCNRKASEFTWNLIDKDIIHLDENGVITAIKTGTSEIEVKDNKTDEISKCIIEVTPAEYIFALYALPCEISSDSSVEVFALTSKKVNKIKFTLYGANLKKTLYAEKYSFLENKVLWSLNLTSLKTGNYTIETSALLGEEWASENSKKINLNVKEKTSSANCSNEKRFASEKIIKFIASCEGFAANLSPDYKNKFFIGYGHIVDPFTPFYQNITKEEAFSILINDVNNSCYSKILNKFLVENNVYFNQNHFDALLSFTYNLGPSWIVNQSSLKNLILNMNTEKTYVFGKITSKDGLNLREGPSFNAKKIASLYYGQEIEILNLDKYNESWYLVKTSSDKIGYCFCDYVKTITKSLGKKYLNDIERDLFIKIFSAYHHAGGKCNRALLSRRFHELDIFLNNKYLDFDYLYCNKKPYDIPDCIKI